MRRWLVILIAGLASVPRARADRIDDAVEALYDGADQRARMKAAAALGYMAKQAGDADVRAILALVQSLSDRANGVRMASARALGRAITSNTPRYERDVALDALATAARTDRSSLVRRLAQRAIDRINAL